MAPEFSTRAALPDMPFIDREDERKVLRDFFQRNSQEKENILLLQGESGLGKTEIIEKVEADLPSSTLLVRLATGSDNNDHSDIVENAIIGLMKALATEPELQRKLKWRKLLIDGVSNLIPGLSSDFSTMLDLESKSAMEIVRYGVGATLKQLGIAKIDREIWFRNILGKVWQAGLNTAFVYENLHACTVQEGRRLLDFLQLLSQAEDAPRPEETLVETLTKGGWSMLITTWPIARHMGESSGLSEFVSRLHRLKHRSCELGKVKPKYMAELVRRYIVNGDKAGYLLREADGNPQLFYTLMMRMAYSGQLEYRDNGVVLPDDLDERMLGADTFENALRTNVVLRHICGLLSLGLDELPLAVLLHARSTLGHGVAAFSDEIHRLEAAGFILKGQPMPPSYHLNHDRTRSLVRAVLHTFSTDSFLLQNALIDGFLNLFSEQDKALLLAAGKVATQVPERAASIYNVGYFIQAAVLAIQCEHRDWLQIVIGAVRLCDALDNSVDLIELAQAFHKKAAALLRPDSAERVCVAALLSKAYYYLGDFEACLAAIDIEQLEIWGKSEFYYFRALSLITAKKLADPFVQTSDLLDAVRSHSSVDRDWLPQITTAHAFAYLESGKYQEAICCYAGFLDDKSNRRDDQGWHTFAMMSPLFTAPDRSADLCEKAKEYFLHLPDMRRAGMAVHNLGYSHLIKWGYEQIGRTPALEALASIYALFDQADHILSQHAREEAGFSKTVKAFILLLKGEGEQARAQSLEALKYFKSPFYISAASINLALAAWMAGDPDASAYLDQIPDVEGLKADPNQSWRIAYARAFICLNRPGGRPAQHDIDACFAALSNLQRTGDLVLFWNALAEAEQAKDQSVRWPTFEGPSGGIGMSFVTPTLARFRASTLFFGHA